MKQLKKSRPLLITAGIILGIVLINWGLRLRNNHVYNWLIDNQAVVQAFSTSDKSSIDAVVKKHGLAYQQIENGNLKYSSQPWLPRPNIISYQQTAASGVILPDAKVSLRSRQPYRFIKNWGIYIAVPICGTDCQKAMYIVYARAVL